MLRGELSGDVVVCVCDHLTSFAILLVSTYAKANSVGNADVRLSKMEWFDRVLHHALPVLCQ